MKKMRNCFNLCHLHKGRFSPAKLFDKFFISGNENSYQSKSCIPILFIFVLATVFSCQKSSVPVKPAILTAHYEIKTHSEFERGYEIFIVIDKISESTLIKGIIFKNKLLENVHFTKMNENEIFIEQYFPIQSKMIYDFSPPKTDSRSDGIVFEVNGEEYFYKVTFKLK